MTATIHPIHQVLIDGYGQLLVEHHDSPAPPRYQHGGVTISGALGPYPYLLHAAYGDGAQTPACVRFPGASTDCVIELPAGAVQLPKLRAYQLGHDYQPSGQLTLNAINECAQRIGQPLSYNLQRYLSLLMLPNLDLLARPMPTPAARLTGQFSALRCWAQADADRCWQLLLCKGNPEPNQTVLALVLPITVDQFPIGSGGHSKIDLIELVVSILGTEYLQRRLTNWELECLTAAPPANTLELGAAQTTLHAGRSMQLQQAGIQRISRTASRPGVAQVYLSYPPVVINVPLPDSLPLAELLDDRASQLVFNELTVPATTALHGAALHDLSALHLVDFGGMAQPPESCLYWFDPSLARNGDPLLERISLQLLSRASPYGHRTVVLAAVYGYTGQPPTACIAIQLPVQTTRRPGTLETLYRTLRPALLRAAGLAQLYPHLTITNCPGPATMPTISPADAIDPRPEIGPAPRKYVYVDLSKIELEVLARLAPELHDGFLHPPSKPGPQRTAALQQIEAEVKIKLRRKGGQPPKPRSPAKFELVVTEADAQRFAKLLRKIGQPVAGPHDSPRPRSQAPTPSYQLVGTQTGRHTTTPSSSDNWSYPKRNSDLVLTIVGCRCPRCDRYWLGASDLASPVERYRNSALRCFHCDAEGDLLFHMNDPERGSGFDWLYYVLEHRGGLLRFKNNGGLEIYHLTPDSTPSKTALTIALVRIDDISERNDDLHELVAVQRKVDLVVAANLQGTQFFFLHGGRVSARQRTLSKYEQATGLGRSAWNLVRSWIGHQTSIEQFDSAVFQQRY